MLKETEQSAVQGQWGNCQHGPKLRCLIQSLPAGRKRDVDNHLAPTSGKRRSFLPTFSFHFSGAALTYLPNAHTFTVTSLAMGEP